MLSAHLHLKATFSTVRPTPKLSLDKLSLDKLSLDKLSLDKLELISADWDSEGAAGSQKDHEERKNTEVQDEGEHPLQFGSRQR